MGFCCRTTIQDREFNHGLIPDRPLRDIAINVKAFEPKTASTDSAMRNLKKRRLRLHKYTSKRRNRELYISIRKTC